MSRQKVSLVWDHQDVTIGIWEETEDGELNYVPVILFNFTVVGFISSNHHEFRGYEIILKTSGGKEFHIVISAADVKNFKAAALKQISGCDLSYNAFDSTLWDELFTKVQFNCKQKGLINENKKPALNYGLQVLLYPTPTSFF